MAKIGIIMGSTSDLEIVQVGVSILKQFGVEYEVIVSSAHRTPEKTMEWVSSAKDRDIKVIIAYAGAAAHLAGVVASHTNLPVVAVPISATSLNGLDALLSMVQMPGGIPVATMAIGSAGSKNAALFASQILALNNSDLLQKLEDYRANMKRDIDKSNENLNI